MKRHLLSICIPFVLAFPAAGFAVDFTPSEVQTVEDGRPTRRLALHEGKTPIFIQAPKSWKMFGSAAELEFLPPSPMEGNIRLGNSTSDPSIRFDEQGLPAYRAAAQRQLSPQATKVEVVSEATDAFPLDDWKSFEMWFSYEVAGVKRRRWVLFVTMNPQRQVRLLADGTEKDFEEIQKAARALLGSWFEPPPGWLALVTPDAR